jgi:cytochrome P450
MFTQLCQTRHDNGAYMSPREIVDHMNFLMLAAHDTLTSSLTAFVYFLAVNPQWQENLRDEVKALGLGYDAPLAYEQLDKMPLTDMAFKESLRLMPPVPSIPRCAVRDIEFGGYRIPKGTRVNVNPVYTHYMAELWPEPEKFDPLRFEDDKARTRHKYAFVPYGGGAHMCLGLHFAAMQSKCFIRHLLATTRVEAAPGYRPEWKLWPIPQPKDGMKLTFKRLS